ncbi:uncharacterized protein BO72DRAFT_493528 [Aspergillus fijiensis CBS 313.89]|uniref:Uncharacterized protein n=1 Tax=Aspergillus fijiensis CBS 313.89 TaxID=1448319 RepID=A0A8G1RWT2_9EURO|nr:uncharacterized protein BO72DRAFT_493528 [Aspergillus fijiensis CBS 313.89]RAK80187.1 hypothetical protein BO72DRAFT_493528 [Aspergillus fijiensis CBS 313.89]
MEKHLKLWSTTKALVLARLFFWKHGRTLQKSFRGLVRGLLHSILSRWLEPIPLLFPRQWQAALSGLRPVTDDDHEVFDAFRKLRETDNEFEGDRAHMVESLKDWISCRSADVKICVGSREDIDLQEAFKAGPMLRLHEVIHEDILSFVQHRLSSSELYPKMGTSDQRKLLETEIAYKSEGVFLWVKLTVQRVEHSILSGDALEDLRKRLGSLPNELEDLFRTISVAIDRDEPNLAYVTILMALYCPEDWPLFRFSFLP